MRMVETAGRSPQLAWHHKGMATAVPIGATLFDDKDDATDRC